MHAWNLPHIYHLSLNSKGFDVSKAPMIGAGAYCTNVERMSQNLIKPVFTFKIK